MNLLTRFKEATGTAWRAVVDLFEPGRAAFSDVFTKELELISRRRAAPSSEGKSVGHNGGLPDFHEPSDILRNVLQALKASEEASAAKRNAVCTRSHPKLMLLISFGTW